MSNPHLRSLLGPLYLFVKIEDKEGNPLEGKGHPDAEPLTLSDGYVVQNTVHLPQGEVITSLTEDRPFRVERMDYAPNRTGFALIFEDGKTF